MTTENYECAVKLIGTLGTGWFGIVRAASPAAAASIARGKHSPDSPSFAFGDRISHVEVRSAEGTKLGDF